MTPLDRSRGDVVRTPGQLCAVVVDAVPPRAVVAGTVERPDATPEELAASCGASYGARLDG